MVSLFTAIGTSAQNVFSLIGSLAKTTTALAGSVLRPGRLNYSIVGKIALNQMYFTGLQATPLIIVIACLIGGVAVMQSVNLLAGIADDLIGSVVVAVIVREMGPLVTAVVLVGRSGTAIATELGAMSLHGELDALKAYRIDSLCFVILPRVLGVCLSCFALAVLFDLAGILGGFAAGFLLKDISFFLLIGKVTQALTNADFAFTALKAVVFGLSIALIACHYGLLVRVSPTELPRAVTKTVVNSLAAIFIWDSLLAAMFYLL
ncbi:MAG: ABC transporter permease [Elusimicrobia bacterium]|nr:ABC transporter permease [Elusimicrobiota bacterium]